MLPDRVSNPGPLTYESGALPIALRGQACLLIVCDTDIYAIMAINISRASNRLILVKDVGNHLSHIIYILIFDFFLNILLFVRLQTPTSSTRCWKEV